MLKDKLLSFSDDQAVTATADSTNHVDTLAAGNAIAKPAYLDVRVKTTFTAGGSATMVIALETDDEATFTSPTILHTTEAIAVATLVAGYKIRIPLPIGVKQFLQMSYTVATGPMTAGAIDAAIVQDVDVTIED